jgi:hypothetical protein
MTDKTLREAVELLKEARKIIRASSSRQLAKDWDRRTTETLADIAALASSSEQADDDSMFRDHRTVVACKGNPWVGWIPLYTAAPVATQPAAPVGLPEGWVPLVLEWEPGYPEEVAFGPQRMMDRLKKWLDRYFALRLADRATAPTAPAPSTEAGREPDTMPGEVRLALAINHHLHAREVLQPLAWHMARGLANDIARVALSTPPLPQGEKTPEDCDCGCNDPCFTEPMEALRFLSDRFKYAGVGHAVALDYARDIDRILAAPPPPAAQPVALTFDDKAALRKEIMAAFSERIPALANHDRWRNWPGTFVFADVALSVLLAKSGGIPRPDGEAGEIGGAA